jgi:hypothetical protein
VADILDRDVQRLARRKRAVERSRRGDYRRYRSLRLVETGWKEPPERPYPERAA